MNDKKCFCYDKSTLIVGKQHLYKLCACLLIGCFCIFMAGFFIGKKRSIDELYDGIERDAFADTMHHSMNMMANQDSMVAHHEEEEPQDAVCTAEREGDHDNASVAAASTVQNTPKYYAELKTFPS